MVGRSLEVLLQGAGYRTRIIEEPTKGDPRDLLEGIRLVLVTPTPSSESRERFLAYLGSTPDAAAIPVLRLSTVINRVLPNQDGRVPWPCRLEDLKSQIDGALLSASRHEVSTNLPGLE